MALFRVVGQEAKTGDQKVFLYDSEVSTLTDMDGNPVIQNAAVQDIKDGSSIEIGKRNLKTVKIQLGLSCNYECEYCSQRFVPKAIETNPDHVNDFVIEMNGWFEGGEDGFGSGVTFEYWGGEPLVYWKTLKPLAEALIRRYPKADHLIVTNGSLLDYEKIKWLDDNNFRVGVSHDGTGQHVRGPDPLMNPESRMAIIELFQRLAPKGMMSFNSMLNSKNMSRAEITAFFEDLISKSLGNDYLQYLVIGEGGFVDAYDEGGIENSLTDSETDIEFRYKSYMEIRDSKALRYNVVNKKVSNFIESIVNGNRLEYIHQKCGMDRENNIAVDLKGNVLTCQNVSSVSSNPAGISHNIGHVSNLEAVEIKTATHLKDRAECVKCPVVHICHGSCMFLTGELWEASCNNSFSDNIAIFANAFEVITGFIPVYIEGPQREDRKDIFWWVNGRPESATKRKKVIKIVEI